jgi:hypothetical protein
MVILVSGWLPRMLDLRDPALNTASERDRLAPSSYAELIERQGKRRSPAARCA